MIDSAIEVTTTISTMAVRSLISQSVQTRAAQAAKGNAESQVNVGLQPSLRPFVRGPAA
jgi:hypothetical protein